MTDRERIDDLAELTPEQIAAIGRSLAEGVEQSIAATIGLSAATSTAALSFEDLKRTIQKFEDDFGPMLPRVESIDWLRDLRRGPDLPDPFLVYSVEPLRVWPMFSFAGLARPDHRMLYLTAVGGIAEPAVSTVATGRDWSRLPRKTKKAIRKLVAGGHVSAAERRRCWRVLRGATIEQGRTR